MVMLEEIMMPNTHYVQCLIVVSHLFRNSCRAEFRFCISHVLEAQVCYACSCDYLHGKRRCGMVVCTCEMGHGTLRDCG